MGFTLSMRGSGRNRNPFPTAAQLQARISAALDTAAATAKSDFDSHGRGYTGGIDTFIEKDGDTVTIGTRDQRAIWVNEGTKPHVITPRSSPSLAFPSVYSPGTAVGQIAGRSAYSGGNTVYSQGVQHPGVEAREVEKAIAKRVGPILLAELRKAVS